MCLRIAFWIIIVGVLTHDTISLTWFKGRDFHLYNIQCVDVWKIREVNRA